MKTLLFITSLLPLFAFGQTQKLLTLKFSMIDSRTSKEFTVVSFDTIKFFQDNQLTNQIIPKNYYYRWPAEIKDFKSGTYRIFYTNLYRKKVSKLITISDTSDLYELNLCWDDLLDYPLNSLPLLKNGEMIKILFSSFGCFHHSQETLVLTRKNNKFIAKLTVGAKTKLITLNQTSIEAFKRFENEIQEVKEGYGCTTTDTYAITRKNYTVKKLDDGCRWKGFYFLKEAIFGKQNNRR